VGFRARHPKLHGKSITGGIRLVIRENKLSFLCQRGQFAFGAPARFAPARPGCEPCFVRFLLCCLIDVAEDGQQAMKLVLGQSSQCFHLTVVSDL
jgi:hypothetical protein